MELLLWLYLYDNRWFFNYKVTIALYKSLWLIPLITHLITSAITFYDFTYANDLTCPDSKKNFVYIQFLFSTMISLNIILFINKISNEHHKETNQLHKAKRVYPILNARIHEHDYWIRRNSVLSRVGLFLLILSMILIGWSFKVSSEINKNNKISCDIFTRDFLCAHANFILYSNIFVLVVLSLMIAIKIIFNILGHYFPNLFVKLSVLFYYKRSNIRTYHYNSHLHFKKLVTKG